MGCSRPITSMSSPKEIYHIIREIGNKENVCHSFLIRSTESNKEYAYKEFKDDGTHKATLSGFEPGKKITITIKGYVPNWCSGKTIMTKTIKLPYYNYYYDEEKCAGNEDFKYCKQLIDVNLTKSEFDKQFELYLKSQQKEEKPEVVTEPEKDNTLYIMIGGAVLVVIIIIIVVSNIIKRRKKNML